jgi:hypothetical protein
VRQREDDMEVRNRQQIGLAGGEPPLLGHRLTLGAMAIPTRNGELPISCLMVSPRFWGAPLLAGEPCRAIRSARRLRLSP